MIKESALVLVDTSQQKKFLKDHGVEHKILTLKTVLKYTNNKPTKNKSIDYTRKLKQFINSNNYHTIGSLKTFIIYGQQTSNLLITIPSMKDLDEYIFVKYIRAVDVMKPIVHKELMRDDYAWHFCIEKVLVLPFSFTKEKYRPYKKIAFDLIHRDEPTNKENDYNIRTIRDLDEKVRNPSEMPAYIRNRLFHGYENNIVDPKYISIDIETKGFDMFTRDNFVLTIGFCFKFSETDVFYNNNVRVVILPDKKDYYDAVICGLYDFYHTMVYKNKIHFIYHNANFDVKVLAYEMGRCKNINPNYVLAMLTTNIEDTMLMQYLINNNASVKTPINLKYCSVEHLGNYGIKHEDVAKETNDYDCFSYEQLSNMARYNGIDCVATYYVFNKSKFIIDHCKHIYKILVLSLRPFISMQLNGLKVNNDKLKKVEVDIKKVHDKATDYLQNMFNKTFQNKTINLNSSAQLKKWLFDYLKLPIIEYTKTKQPSLNKNSLEALISLSEENADQYNILKNIQTYNNTAKIISTVIPNIVDNAYNGRVYGDILLGGTISGRASSKSPNLQNFPNGSIYGKLVRSVFEVDNNHCILEADYNALEDRAYAIQSNDPERIKIYTDNYDSHSLKSFIYFPEEFGDDIIDTPESINTIKEKYPYIRYKSKPITFCLTYLGTVYALVRSAGLSQEKAEFIKKRDEVIYKVSLDYLNRLIHRAKTNGYLLLLFGLPVQTKYLVPGSKSLSSNQVKKEIKTLNNINTQCYSLLINTALIRMFDYFTKHKMHHNHKLILTVHDSIYLELENDKNLIAEAKKLMHYFMSEKIKKYPAVYHDKIGFPIDIEIKKTI